MRISLLIAVLLLTSASVQADPQRIELLGMTSQVPAGWAASEPSSTMRLAQFRVPAAGDASTGDDAEMVVYYFGPGQGGSVEANVDRWVSQFSRPDGAPVEPVITRLEGALPATLVELRGSYARGVGVGPGGESLPDRMLLAAVVETPKGNLYPQLHGPAEVVAAAKEAFVAFVQGIEPVSGP